MTDISLGYFEDGSPAVLDLDKLIGTHLCIQGNSGAGKSGAIRRLLEVTHGKLQHIVLDVEDEFYTLRERFDYMIAGGDNGDCAANVNNAAALAMTILKTGYSAVVQINNLQIDQRREFIAIFLDTLLSAPKEYWRPALIVLDESQMYAPQVGQVASSAAVISLMTLGRKRGFTGVLATPRISSISKDATGPVNNWLMGRIGQPADRRATADALGFRANSDEARGLMRLKTRQFWAFGPALSIEPTQIKIGDVQTTVIKAGQVGVPTAPAPAAMRKILAELNAAAKGSDQEGSGQKAQQGQSHTGSDQLGANNADLDAAHRAGLSKGYEDGFADGYLKGIASGRRHITGVMTELRGAVEASIAEAERLCDLAYNEANGSVTALADGGPGLVKADQHAALNTPANTTSSATSAGEVGGAAASTLQALAWWASIGVSAPTKKQLAAMLKIDPAGSTMRARLAELSKGGLVEYPQPGTVRLTPAGVAAAPVPDRSATLIATIRSSLPDAILATFNALPSKPGEIISKEALAKALNVEAGGSTLRARLAALSGRELIEYPKPGLVTRQEWVVGR